MTASATATMMASLRRAGVSFTRTGLPDAAIR
jgi:hypothetical protein